jgi:hypothetical protein
MVKLVTGIACSMGRGGGAVADPIDGDASDGEWHYTVAIKQWSP